MPPQNPGGRGAKPPAVSSFPRSHRKLPHLSNFTTIPWDFTHFSYDQRLGFAYDIKVGTDTQSENGSSKLAWSIRRYCGIENSLPLLFPSSFPVFMPPKKSWGAGGEVPSCILIPTLSSYAGPFVQLYDHSMGFYPFFIR